MKNTIIILTLLLLSSCSYQYTQRTPGRVNEVTPNVILTPAKIFDYKVDFTRRVEGASEGKLEAPKIGIDHFKEDALVQANISAKCDFLVNPIYQIEVNGAYIKVKVFGYPATFTSERDIQAADSIHLQLNRTPIKSSVAATAAPARANTPIRAPKFY